MDIATPLGLLIAFGALFASWRIVGCGARELIDLPMLLLVTVSSFGLAVASSNLRGLASIPQVLSQLRQCGATDSPALVRIVVALAHMARIEGMLSLERLLPDIKNAFLRRGVELVVDGKPSQVIREILETEMLAYYQKAATVGRFFSCLGGIAPSLGVVFAISSLMSSVPKADTPEKLGAVLVSSISAVLYGLIIRCFVSVPIANRIRAFADDQIATHSMLIEGIIALHASETPSTIQDRMTAFLLHDHRRRDNFTRRPRFEMDGRVSVSGGRVS